VATGSDFTCAWLDNGQVSCWGYNKYGQLGDGTTTARPTAAPASNLANVVQVVATVDSSELSDIFGPTACAHLGDGTVACWGDNSFGKLGNPGIIDQADTPVAVTGLAGVSDLAAGCYFFCAVTSSIVKCWGSNAVGQLGNEDTAQISSSPSASVTNLTNVTNVAAGASHACALLGNGKVYCWGGNNSGQLGNGTTVSSAIPVQVL
jgi:alpha-tubulin suppressor-like RCC1 family protein